EVDGVIDGVFYHAGQFCSAGNRLIVGPSIHDKFVEALVRRGGNIKLGSGFDDASGVDPLMSQEDVEEGTDYVTDGVKEGATSAVGGAQPEDPALADGFFYLPTVLTNCTTDMDVVQDEGVGPVITVETFTTEEEAVFLANDSDYGLSGGVWSTDIAKAERIAAKMRMGTVWINDFNIFFAQAPWGGYKQSGIGHELGVQGLEEYTEIKHVYHNLDPQASHWFGMQ